MTESEIQPETDLTATAGPEATEGQKTFTQDEVNAIIAKEKGRLKAHYEQTEKEKLDAIEEQKRIDALKGEERLNALHATETAKLKQANADLARQLAIATASSRLSELGLDPAFAPNLIGADDEATAGNIDRFNKMVEAQVSKRVKASLTHGAPPDPTAGGSTRETEMASLRKILNLRGE